MTMAMKRTFSRAVLAVGLGMLLSACDNSPINASKEQASEPLSSPATAKGEAETAFSSLDLTPLLDPAFGENVLVFSPALPTDYMQTVLDALHRQQAPQEFSQNRYAVLYKPGDYDLHITVDFYVQTLGLGLVPSDVKIRGAVQSTTVTEDNKVTTQFWRGAENFHVTPSMDMMYWAVSQAAPYRRMHIAGNVNFDKHYWASGGFLANSIVEGRAGLTSGQQWFTRNSSLGKWEGGNWNRVFVGVEGTPDADWPKTPTTVIDSTPIIREKPFLTFDEGKGYAVFVPALQENTRGVSWPTKQSPNAEAGRKIPLSNFYIAHAKRDTAATINDALGQGKNLLFTPGIYRLDQAIEINRANTVVLGLGLPSLLPTKGNAVLRTADVDGVVLAGIMADANLPKSSALFEVGSLGTSADHSANPSSLHDIFCRVGGPHIGQTESCLVIHSNNVIGDHFWLWRGDHGKGVAWEENRSANGLIVTGDDVTIYGLFNEHFQEYQTLWQGERGRTYFYQSEIPYRPPNFDSWNSNGNIGYPSYKVADNVKEHYAIGLGIYSFFQSEPTVSNNMRLENAIETPNSKGILFEHMVLFAGLNGGINHVINGVGPGVDVNELKTFSRYPEAAK